MMGNPSGVLLFQGWDHVGEKTEQDIKDIAGLITSVAYIKEAVDRNYGAILAINSDVDELQQWREGHRETHKSLSGRIKVLSGVYAALTAIMGWFGVNNG